MFQLLIGLAQLLLYFIYLSLVYVKALFIVDHLIYLNFCLGMSHNDLLSILFKKHVVEVICAQVFIVLFKENAPLLSIN